MDIQKEKIRNKIFFITGGAGFIGSSFIKEIIENNEVIVYDNLDRDSLTKREFFHSKNLTLIKGDILNFSKLKKSIPKDINFVIHMAAIAGVDTVIKNPVKTMEINIIGTYNLLKALYEKKLIKKIERFINFSTSEVFGVNAIRVEEKQPSNLQPVGEARWNYAISKLAGEFLTFSYYDKFGLNCTILRPFNIYGPGQIGEGAIHHFVVRAIKNEPLLIHGNGDQIRSWCYIDDMVEGIKLCIIKEKAIGEVFHIGNPRGTITVLSLAEKIVQLANSKSKLIYIEKKYSDVEIRIPDIRKSMQLLHFKPKVDLNEGIKKTIEWYKKQEIL
ncbi:MAG TPA: GDP-mannose 4,6-dehydratase [bacterium]|nr:GDP-mannose 4,6-dehydratase [bacterium]